MQNSDIEALLANFWAQKSEAVRVEIESGRAGVGGQSRNAKHMQNLNAFVHQMFIDAGLDESEVMMGKSIPGYYRRSKNWDVVAVHKGNLVALVELKSQVGSEGNNGNNRIEEALGNTFDASTTQDLTEAFGKLPVWSAFCMVFGSDPSTAKPVRMRGTPVFPIEEIFKGMTYGRQWEIAIERFIQTKAYDAGWFLSSWMDGDSNLQYTEPVAAATLQTLQMQIEARVKFAKQTLVND